MSKKDVDNLIIEVILEKSGRFSVDQIYNEVISKISQKIKIVKEYIAEKMDFLYEMGFIGKTRLYYFSI